MNCSYTGNFNNNEILTKIWMNIQINGKMVVMYYTKSGGKIVSVP